MEKLYQDYGQNTKKVIVLSMDIGQSSNAAIDNWLDTTGPANYPAIGGANAENYWGYNFYSLLGGKFTQLVVIIPNDTNPGASTISYSYGGGSLAPARDYFIRKSLTTNGFYAGIADYNLLNNNVNIYPNPAQDNVTIEFIKAVAGEVNVSIYNIIGEIVKSQTIYINNGKNTVELDVSALDKGCYMVKIRSEQAANMIKLQIVK